MGRVAACATTRAAQTRPSVTERCLREGWERARDWALLDLGEWR